MLEFATRNVTLRVRWNKASSWKKPMKQTIDTLVSQFESGSLTRRQLVQALLNVCFDLHDSGPFEILENVNLPRIQA